MRNVSAFLTLSLLAAGCAADDPSFAWTEGDAPVAVPETEQERTAALLAALFAPTRDDRGEIASAVDVLLEALVPSAHADGDSCAPSEDPSWVTLSLQGSSGTFGASQNAVSLDADRDYCQDTQGNWNSGNRLYKSFQIHGVEASCNWGEHYTVTASGVLRRIGQSMNKDVNASFTFAGADVGSADCSLQGNAQSDDALHLGGSCSGWTAGFPATPGTACTLELED
jgi:hypothetical protein